MNDLIRREDAIEALRRAEALTKAFGYHNVIDTIRELPSVDIDLSDYSDRLWRNAYEQGKADAEPRWIPVKTRPMDEEEKRYWEEHYAYTFGEDYDGIMFDCPMPEDGQEVWVCSKSGYVWEDTCEVDIGFGLEGNGDWDDIVAWMPFERPEPWKGENDET